MLLVEDNPVDSIFIEKALRGSACADEIHCVATGEEALEFLVERTTHPTESTPLPKLIILDVKLPRMSGFEFLQTIRSQSRYKDVSIVVFSGTESEFDRKMALDLGANGFVLKPFNMANFSCAVEEIAKGCFGSFTIEAPPPSAVVSYP